MKTTVVNSFRNVEFRGFRAVLISVYYMPDDLQDTLYIARAFNLDQPTEFVIKRNTLEEIRNEMPYGMIPIPRDDKDPLSVVETWI